MGRLVIGSIASEGSDKEIHSLLFLFILAMDPPSRVLNVSVLASGGLGIHWFVGAQKTYNTLMIPLYSSKPRRTIVLYWKPSYHVLRMFIDFQKSSISYIKRSLASALTVPIGFLTIWLHVQLSTLGSLLVVSSLQCQIGSFRCKESRKSSHLGNANISPLAVVSLSLIQFSLLFLYSTCQF